MWPLPSMATSLKNSSKNSKKQTPSSHRGLGRWNLKNLASQMHHNFQFSIFHFQFNSLTMKNILIITPMAAEQENMLNALNNYPLPLLNAYTIRRGYVGKVYAAASTALALAEEHYDLVAVIGYAAASDAYNTGDIVCPRFARYHDAHVPEGLDGVDFLTKPYALSGG